MGFFPRLPISAPAKCAQLLVSIKQKRPEDQDAEGAQKVLHFGTVAVGCTAERQIKLYNPSAVCLLLGGIGAWAGRTTGPDASKTPPLYKVPSSSPCFGPKPHITHVC